MARFITNAGGTVDFSGVTSGAVNTGSIEGAGTYSLGSNSLTVGGNDLSTTVSGLIEDGGLGGSLFKTGTGTLTLSGANTYSGFTTVADGTLSLANSAALGTSTVINTGSVIDYAHGVDIANTIVFGSVGTQFQVLTGATATQSGPILEDAPGRPLEKIGDGVLIVASFQNSGATTISEGTWQAGQAAAFSANSAHTVEAGAMLDLNGFDQNIDSLFGAGTVTNNGAADAVFAIGNFGASVTPSVFSGVIEDGATNNLSLTVDTPSLILTGTNTYTGGTLICDCATRSSAMAAPPAPSSATSRQCGPGRRGQRARRWLLHPGRADLRECDGICRRRPDA